MRWWIGLGLFVCLGCEAKKVPEVDFTAGDGVGAAPVLEPRGEPAAKKVEAPVFAAVTTEVLVAPEDASVTLPTVEVVRGWFEGALRAQDGVTLDPKAQGAPEFRVGFTADTAVMQGSKIMGVRVIAAIQGGEEYQVQLGRQLLEGERVEVALEESARALARDIAMDQSLKGRSLQEIQALLGAPDFLPRYTAESALARCLRERTFEDEALVIRYLSHPSERVVVQVTGWLVRRRAKVGPQLVAAAERLSREKKFMALQAVVLQMGSISDDIVKQYLNAMATGHEVPEIRQAAKQAARAQR